MLYELAACSIEVDHAEDAKNTFELKISMCMGYIGVNFHKAMQGGLHAKLCHAFLIIINV